MSASFAKIPAPSYLDDSTVSMVLARLFPSPGYFVEAGAHDGIGDSLTYPLEQQGWQGVCVEPSSAYHGLTLSRKCNKDNRCLWIRDREFISFREMSGEAIELSGLPIYFGDRWDRDNLPFEVKKKPSVTLTTLLKEHKAPNPIHFLCLDTEGSEYAILAYHSFTLYRFLTILVEHNGVESRRESLCQLLSGQGYTLYASNERDHLFIYSPFLQENLNVLSTSHSG